MSGWCSSPTTTSGHAPNGPRGRWLTVANRRVIVDARRIDPRTERPWQDYPLQDPDGTVLDEPLLHRLVYTHDPDYRQ